MDTNPVELPRKQTLYLQVYDILSRRIANGTIKEHSFLPNEFDLSREFQVSIGTVRKAVELLVQENLLVRQQGRGTIVNDRRRFSIRNKANRIRHGPGANLLHWRYSELEFRQVPATDAVAQKLRLQPGDAVHFVRRIRRDDYNSVILEDNHSPVSVFPELPCDQHGSRSALSRMLNLGEQIGHIDEACMAVSAPKHAASLMGVEPNAPLLKMDRVAYDRSDTPIEYRLAYMHSVESYYWSTTE